MELGQKSVIHFVSQFAATIAGFLATIFLARVLGADTLGTYFLVIAVLTWVKMFSTMGITRSVSKRISETDEPGEFLTAGLLIQITSVVIVSLSILLFRGPLQEYTGYSNIEVLIVLLLSGSFFGFITSLLVGEGLAHVAGALNPLDRIIRTIVQLTLVVLGFELLGLFLGYIVASVIAATVGIYFVAAKLEYPEKRHFISIWSYAKYSWIGNFSNRSLASMDTIVLGLFVTSDLIGIYEIAWNVASVLAVFGVSINQTLFPEISSLDEEASEEVADLAQTGVAYSGLFLIPGLIGGSVLGEVILSVYSAEFRQGYVVLVVLILARLISTYKSQFTNVIDAINRPDVTFRVDGVFVTANIVLNIVLVYLYGWIGAAVATAVSALLGALLSYDALVRLTEFRFPIAEVSKQVVSAFIMGIFIYAGAEFIAYELVPSLFLIPIGALIYFAVLLVISRRFRTIVRNNAPDRVHPFN
ncbi:polysaccharide biosynthesis protein [Halorubrum coriense DSM 10284]|uniref:Polysaccharide biosynthesis protein n=1 Tax=Halorubrum coriense DSM 10284 TaxID=1227466 RepID=M0EHG7_9EURY|nr:oligosaccharide flippase family protein [Halorubrum coriense]ELZ47195.1 polysaccharide biosynthesis protein [Halorubrum coriense DSM 10284]